MAVPGVPARRRPAPDLQSPASEWAPGGRAAWERGWSYGVQSVVVGVGHLLLCSGCQEPCFGRGYLCKVTWLPDGPAGTALSQPAPGGFLGEVSAGQGSGTFPGQGGLGEPWEVSSAGDRAAGSQLLIWAGGGAPAPHGRPHPTAGHGPLGGANEKAGQAAPPGHWGMQRACVQTRWQAGLLSPVAVLTEGRPALRTSVTDHPGLARGRPPPWSLLPCRGGGLPASPRAYFLLSSLARQVAASTALMVAARSPPCSRACSP